MVEMVAMVGLSGANPIQDSVGLRTLEKRKSSTYPTMATRAV